MIMSDFRRRGFVRASHGILWAAKIWHGATFSEVEGKAAFNGHGPLTAESSTIFAEYTRLVSDVVERLRVLLRDGELRSFLFNRQLSNLFQKVPSEYWAKPESAAMLERLFFEAFEIQSSVSQPVPRDSIYFSVGDLTELLEPGFANERLVFDKPHLDQGMKKDLADALRSLSERHPKLRRPDQYKMARELPEFRQYRITDRDLREAARKAPIPPGRPRKE
jgi:hypothetical protein